MSAFARFKSFTTALLRNRRVERDMEDEWRFHVEARVEELVASGLSRADAERRARREFGDPLRWKEQSREARGLRWLHDTSSDVQYALRQMRRAPAFAAVAIATLALGIGANTAIFSLVNGLLLRALPVAEPNRLVAVSRPSADASGDTVGWTYAIFKQIEERATTTFDGAVAWSVNSPEDRLSLTNGGGEIQPVEAVFVSGNFFTELGVQALIGRTFTSADDERGGGPDGPVALISYGMWQRRFGGTADVIGTPLVVERIPFTIIGVTPPEFFGAEVGRTFDIAVPINAERLIRGKDSAIDGAFYWLSVMLRLKPEQSTADATALLRAAQPQIREAAMPTMLSAAAQKQFLQEPFSLVAAAMGTSRLRQRYQRPLLALLVVVSLVLLIACANVANLLLARAVARRHELTVRAALGATRWRLARQLFVESLLLAGMGAAVGLLASLWASRALVTQLSTSVNTVFLDLSLDWRVMAFTAAVTIATVILFGTAPAFRATRISPIDALKEQGRSAIGGRRFGVANALVTVQIALSLMLVVAAGLFVQTFARLAASDLGFDADRVLMVNVDVMRASINPANRLSFHHDLVDAIAAVPGVAHAGGSMVTPVGGGGMVFEIALPGDPTSQPEPGPAPFWNSHSTLVNAITPRWLATYGTAVRAGRDFNRGDNGNAPRVALVNEMYTRRFLPGRNPVGETVTFAKPELAPMTIVGVVSDAVYISVRDGVRPTVYVPLPQVDFGPPLTRIFISVRPATGSPAQLAPSVAAALTGIDRNLAFSFRPLQDRVAASLVRERLVAMLSGVFGTLALLLAGIGLYGVTAYGVSRQKGEIGVRLALGAQPGRVVRQVLGRVLVLVGAGIAVGAVASMWLSSYVQTLLFGLEPSDLTTLATSAAILAAVGAFAGWLPAYRASRIDPAEVLREN